MKVSFERIFEKDAKKLPTEIQQKLKNLISTVQWADSLS
jgi:mRNA-degrading endonuclease RelE of RelBE toxin-antitoxin system